VSDAMSCAAASCRMRSTRRQPSHRERLCSAATAAQLPKVNTAKLYRSRTQVCTIRKCTLHKLSNVLLRSFSRASGAFPCASRAFPASQCGGRCCVQLLQCGGRCCVQHLQCGGRCCVQHLQCGGRCCVQLLRQPVRCREAAARGASGWRAAAGATHAAPAAGKL
jgi:hypothetical protein